MHSPLVSPDLSAEVQVDLVNARPLWTRFRGAWGTLDRRQAAGRLAELAAITRARGRAFRPALEGEDLVAAVAEDWYVDWHR